MLRFLIFFTIYFTVYGGIHIYFYRRLNLAFSLNPAGRVSLKLFLLLMVFGPIVSRLMERQGLETSVEPIALFVFVWMGVLFLCVSLFFVIDIARAGHWLYRRFLGKGARPLELPWRGIAAGVVVISTTVALFGFYEAREIRVEKVTLPTTKLPEGVSRYRMVQLTDVHLGVLTDEAWLRNIVTEVNKLEPDLIVSTGDIIDSSVPSSRPYLTTLGSLKAADGKYGVAGNHEFFAGIDNAVGFMNEAGFVMLRGERAEVKPWLHLLGIDDREGRHAGVKVVDHELPLMAANDASALTILLKHQPVVREESVGKFDLQLAGHVHQGQIFPFRILTWIAYPIAMGLNDLGQGSQIYVARGTGTWGPPIRVMAPPEITLFEFVKSGT